MKIFVKGYVGSDSDLRKFGDGDTDYVLNVSLAEHKVKKTSDGKKVVVTTWHKVTLWRNFAKAMAPILKRGRKIFVEGEFNKVETFTRGNTIATVLNIDAKEIDLLDDPKSDDAPAMPVATNEELAAEAPADEVAPWEQV